MTLPTVIQRRDQKSVKIIGKVLFKLGAGNSRFRRSLHQNARIQPDTCRRSFRGRTGQQSVLNVAQQIVTDGAAHRVFGERTMDFNGERSVEVVSQLIFKFVAKHLLSLSNFEISDLRSEIRIVHASTTRIRRRIFASSIRPRFIRDFTVPSGIFRRSTISW